MVEDEDHHADQEHEKLHGNLEQPVEEQPHAAFGDGSGGQVTLHLRLVGPEVGHRQKEPTQKTGPKGVAPARIR